MNKQERILFSKKIVEADPEIALINQAKQEIINQKNADMTLDNANKSLLDPVNNLITSYHQELGRYTGNFRVNLTESIIQDAASLVLGNFLFPNDINNYPPSLSSQKVWPHTNPFALNVLIGKQYNETYPAPVPTHEVSKINEALSIISNITSVPLITRVTGQHCVSDSPTTDPAIHNLLNDLIGAITFLNTYVLNTIPHIPTSDPDPVRASKATAATNNANDLLNAINVWLAYPNFNTAHGQTTCAGFHSYDPALLGDTKLQSGPLTTLTNALNDRLNYLTNTRVPDINAILGHISQDINTGNITSSSGLYGKRYQFLLLRLNRLSGSLIKVKNADIAIAAQDNLIANIQNSKATYSSMLHVSLLTAPSNGTNSLHLKSTAGFSVGDGVYIVSDTKDEIFFKITAIESGGRIRTSIDIPPLYLPAEFARVYKTL